MEERKMRPRARKPRRKVCQFCVDKVDYIDYKDAAKLVNKIRPEVVIPTHYGGIVGDAEDGEKLKGRVDEGIEGVLKL